MLKVKKSLIKFEKGYEIEKNKWKRLENIAFLEKICVIYLKN
tara:strand:+ start:1178 stop:1303 length:126 start_codon:yes stop_codon:yes gene_type:complete